MKEIKVGTLQVVTDKGNFVDASPVDFDGFGKNTRVISTRAHGDMLVNIEGKLCRGENPESLVIDHPSGTKMGIL